MQTYKKKSLYFYLDINSSLSISHSLHSTIQFQPQWNTVHVQHHIKQVEI